MFTPVSLHSTSARWSGTSKIVMGLYISAFLKHLGSRLFNSDKASSVIIVGLANAGIISFRSFWLWTLSRLLIISLLWWNIFNSGWFWIGLIFKNLNFISFQFKKWANTWVHFALRIVFCLLRHSPVYCTQLKLFSGKSSLVQILKDEDVEELHTEPTVGHVVREFHCHVL